MFLSEGSIDWIGLLYLVLSVRLCASCGAVAPVALSLEDHLFLPLELYVVPLVVLELRGESCRRMSYVFAWTFFVHHYLPGQIEDAQNFLDQDVPLARYLHVL